MHYFDHAATRPILPEALATLVEVSTDFPGNPSSTHAPGAQAAARLTQAKSEICEACNFTDGRLVLTSGGTEANNLALATHRLEHPRGRLLVAADVHASIWHAVEREPKQCDVLALGPDGQLDPATVVSNLNRRTSLVAVSHVCNETGVVHPVAEIARLCAARGVALLVDGVQAIGHLPVDLATIPATFFTFSAHKLGGPRGVGGIFLRQASAMAMWGGGAQEWGLRPGTENVAGLAAAATALTVCLSGLAQEEKSLRRFGNFLAHSIQARLPSAILNSDPENGVPGLVSMSFPGLQASSAVTELDLLGFAVSAGSACHASTVFPSRAILARGHSESVALGTLRFSMGRGNSGEDVAALAEAVHQVVERQLRQTGGSQ